MTRGPDAATAAPRAASVVFAPDYSQNPYLDLLQDSLERRGFEVRRDSKLMELSRSADVPDVVHLHWERHRTVHPSRATAVRQSVGLLRALYRLRRRGARVVWTVHNLRDHEAPHPLIERLAQCAIARVAHRLVVHYPKAVDRASRWLNVPQSRFEVMPFGRYPVAVDMTRAEAREALGLPEDKLIVASVGLIRRYKRIPELITSVRGLDSMILLLVAGQPYHDEADRIVKAAAGDPRIVLALERQSDEQMGMLLTAADAFVLASRNQFSSSSVLLAMAYRCVIISCESDHVRFLAGESDTVFLPDEPPFEAVADLAELDTDELRARGERNAERAASFGWGKAAEILDAIYNGPSDSTVRSGTDAPGSG